MLLNQALAIDGLDVILSPCARPIMRCRVSCALTSYGERVPLPHEGVAGTLTVIGGRALVLGPAVADKEVVLANASGGVSVAVLVLAECGVGLHLGGELVSGCVGRSW